MSKRPTTKDWQRFIGEQTAKAQKRTLRDMDRAGQQRPSRREVKQARVDAIAEAAAAPPESPKESGA